MTKDPKNKEPGGQWMNSSQAARYLAYPSIRALYQAIRRGQVPHYRHGKRLLFKKGELDQVIEEGKIRLPF